MPDVLTSSRPKRVARVAWPVALLLFALPVAAELLVVDRYATSEVLYAPLMILPVLLAVLFPSYAIGGRRGVAVGVGLFGLVVYWAWWFGWGLDGNISRFSFGIAADGLADASIYHLALAIGLWPLLLAAIAATWLLARRRGWQTWPALGLLTLVLVAAAFPSGDTWSDGCNSTSGATPLLTRPLVTPLMDAGVGVLPVGIRTLAYCPDVGDRQWKPFWLGSDGLPPRPGRQGSAQVLRPAHRVPQSHRTGSVLYGEHTRFRIVRHRGQIPAAFTPLPWTAIGVKQRSDTITLRWEHGGCGSRDFHIYLTETPSRVIIVVWNGPRFSGVCASGLHRPHDGEARRAAWTPSAAQASDRTALALRS